MFVDCFGPVDIWFKVIVLTSKAVKWPGFWYNQYYVWPALIYLSKTTRIARFHLYCNGIYGTKTAQWLSGNYSLALNFPIVLIPFRKLLSLGCIWSTMDLVLIWDKYEVWHWSRTGDQATFTGFFLLSWARAPRTLTKSSFTNMMRMYVW
jgi:hypothetical protein